MSPSATANEAISALPIVWRDDNDGGGEAQHQDGHAKPAGPPSQEFLDAAWAHQFNHRRAVATRVPRAVVHATHPSHVVGAVKLAKALGVRVSVRSGGHSWACWGVRDDAVLIDLGGLPGGKFAASASAGEQGQGQGQDGQGKEGLVYDDRTKVVGAPPSATGRLLNAFLATHGRLFAGGHCPDVGLGGFLLQGGMGWNCKNWGWACESVVGIDVVTAAGEERYCSQSENADLFWAARGAGPGFPAIVTRFYLMTRPLPKFFESVYVYRLTHYRQALQWVIDVSPTADPDTEIVALSQYVDGIDDEPVIIAAFLTMKADQAEAEAALRAIHDDPRRPQETFVADVAVPMSLPHQYIKQDVANPPNHRYCSDNAYIRNDETDVPGVLEEAFTSLPSRKSFSLYFAMAPTSRRAHYGNDDGSDDDVDVTGSMALSLQSDHYYALYTVWEDAGEDAQCLGHTRRIMRGLEGHSVGSYLGDADMQARDVKFWRDAHARRLMAIRKKWDPEGRICGFLDEGDKSGVEGLRNVNPWEK